jgi:hypothetical protein
VSTPPVPTPRSGLLPRLRPATHSTPNRKHKRRAAKQYDHRRLRHGNRSTATAAAAATTAATVTTVTTAAAAATVTATTATDRDGMSGNWQQHQSRSRRKTEQELGHNRASTERCCRSGRD